MGKLSALAERIKDTKTRLEAQADVLALQLDDIDATAPAAFDRGAAFIAAQKAEVDEIEATLRQLSNLPLDGSAKSGNGLQPGASEKPAGESKSAEHAQLPPGGAAVQPPFPGAALK